jgi:hypothetical protein
MSSKLRKVARGDQVINNCFFDSAVLETNPDVFAIQDKLDAERRPELSGVRRTIFPFQSR